MNWKDKGGIVAVITCAGTLTFAYATLLPLYNQHQTVKIEQLEGKVIALTERTIKAESRTEELETKYAQATSTTVFDEDSLYPRGFRNIKMGMPFSKAVEMAGLDAKIKRIHMSVEDKDHGYFKEATYFPGVTNNLIIGVLYFYRDTPKTDEAAEAKMQETIKLLRPAFPNVTITKSETPTGVHCYDVSRGGKLLLQVTGSHIYYELDADPIAAAKVAKLEKF
ncbi:TPA: hypothetical protein SMQ04_001567 [Pseudomonas putida]|uniref:hypothetical protein n=1 Tax=unclassified Pseudomonas TaxID=196821 RepID=UPI0006D3C82F|nr:MULTISPECIES: hypothetical protein [unclassified Pseudomonas]HEK0906820.1 hypothetical protein [Pseudomonas putida]